MNHHIIRALAAAGLCLALLAGCESAEVLGNGTVYIEDGTGAVAEAAEEVELTFFGFKADALNLTAIETALQGYMDENPEVSISYEGLKSSAYWDALDARAENDALDNIFMVHHDDVVKLKAEGKLSDLSDLATLSNFSDMARSQFTESDGTVYFLPTMVTTFGFYVNYDLLEEYGYEVPTNWDELAQVCDGFAAQGIVPIVGNNFTTWRSLIAAKSLYPVYQLDDPAELIEKFNTGEVNMMDYLSDGIDLVGEMLDRGWFDREEALVTQATSDDLELFAAGDRPFMITGSWATPRVMALEPDFKYGIYPFPILEDGSVLVMNVDTCISVSSHADNVDIAKDFVEYLTQPDVILDYCDTQSSYTPLDDERTPSDDTMAPSVEYLFNGRSVIGSDYRLELPLDSASNEVGKAMLSGVGTEEAKELMAQLLYNGGE
jgi:raffinose/stachyose/melibiose transport system substrate-binding protein